MFKMTIILIIIFCQVVFGCYNGFAIKNSKGKYLNYPPGKIYKGNSYHMQFTEENHQLFDIVHNELIGCNIHYHNHTIGIMPNGQFVLHHNKNIIHNVYEIFEIVTDCFAEQLPSFNVGITTIHESTFQLD